MTKLRVDLTGQTFGRLTVLRRAANLGVRVAWLCRCECGNENVVRTYALKGGGALSCGCLHREVTIARCLKHGASLLRNQTSEYRIWIGIKQRCMNPNNGRYSSYGGRGIFVCERWQGGDGFAHFLADVGPRPSPEHSIERKDNDGPYSTDNCVWSTRDRQSRNTRRTVLLTFCGKTQTLQDWAIELGVSQSTLSSRRQKGLTDAAILGPSVRRSAGQGRAA